MTDIDLIAQINALSSPLGAFRPSPREKAIGRSAAYRERLNSGKLPMREARARRGRGQVPMVVKGSPGQRELLEVDELGTSSS